MKRDLGRGLTKNLIMATAGTLNYDGHQALSRIKQALRARQEIDSDQHGQAKVAAGFVGVSQSVWANWRKRGAPMSALAEIAVLLDVDVYYLLGTTDEMGHFGQLGAREIQENFSGEIGEIRSQISSICDRLAILEGAS